MLKNPKTQKPTVSVENLIEVLPVELRSNFTFVYQSRSPFKESIDYDYPRVVLFTTDAKFIITYTGAPDKPGYQLIETMAFDEESSKFKMSIFDLNEDDKISKKIKVSTCSSCHGKDIRPIFDSYPLWPGFYGSVLDSFPKDISIVDKEKRRYQKFLKTVSHKKAYSKLNFNKDSKVAPYLETAKLLLNENNEAVNPDSRFKPNERLGIALTSLNKRRVFNKLKSSLQYKSKRKEILYELLDCGSSKVNPDQEQAVLTSLIEENEKRLNKMESLGLERNTKLLQMQEVLFYREIAQIDWAANLLGVNRRDWSMALEDNALSFYDGILSGAYKNRSFYVKEDFIFEILKDLASEEKPYSPFFLVGYNLERYDVPSVEKIDWEAAVKSCKPLGKDILAAKFKGHKREKRSLLRAISEKLIKLIEKITINIEKLASLVKQG